jgi:Na+/H+ antiporter NhaA
MAGTAHPSFAERSAWARSLSAPVRVFVQNQAGSAVFLLGGALVALAWANLAPSSYESFWTTHLDITLGSWTLSEDLRHWVNDGLMTLFFFVVGLEARREFDMGELRERKRISLPVLAGVGGMLIPVLIYLAINGSRDSAAGWGVAMSTDTAFALGVLALVATRAPARLRVFLLTVAIVDDLIALTVIAVAYTEELDVVPLLIGVALFAAVQVIRRIGIGAPRGIFCLIFGVAAWIAVLESGVDPVIVGLAMGLATSAYPAPRADLEHATDLFRAFREQPTSELAREARLGLLSSISPNERLQTVLHPWTSYVVVPLFAVANAGITVDEEFLRRAATSPITLGIVAGYVIGKPLGITLTPWIAVKLDRHRLKPPVTWPVLAGGGAVAGIGFTVSLLIAGLAFQGEELEEAKAGVLAAAACAAIVAWIAFRIVERLPTEVRIRQLAATAESLIDLSAPVDEGRDHVRGGGSDAPVTLVEYGDFECPFCGQAEPVVRDLLAEFGDELRYVWRHLPLADVHPRAQLASEAAEAASAQDSFWPMYDRLLASQSQLKPNELVEHARGLGLDVDRFADELRRHVYAPRVAEDVDDADRSGVSGTPTFFVNGQRHHGAYDVATLSAAVRAARRRALADQAAATAPIGADDV